MTSHDVQDEGRPIEILMIEDNPGDVRLTERLLRRGKLALRLSVVEDGVDALAYLRREAPFENATRPDLILLDWNLPRKGGDEVLKEVKADEDLRTIPVVVLTSSEAERDVLAAYRLHANCFITKPVDFEQLAKVVRSIEEFWLTIVKLP